MPMSVRQFLVLLIGICLTPIWLSACNPGSQAPDNTPVGQEATLTPVLTPEPSRTPLPPTATPVPLAAIINGEEITLTEFQAEVGRYQASTVITGTILATDTNTIVMDELIEQTLLAQSATEKGYVVNDTLVETRINALEDQLGGQQALQDWENSHGYSADDFRRALRRSIGAAWMRDQVIHAVPETAEQVHVLQILLTSSAQANQVYSQLQSGEDFKDIATTYDSLTQGDLGWFPRGYLSEPEIEAAAFSLQPGQYSTVLKTETGYHILYLLERDPAHPLQPDARRALQEKALQDWIVERKAQSEIQLFLP
jgi:peptidyl-prolyl cis-trans isomerase C